TVDIRLLPPGVILPAGLTPLPMFVVLPASPAANTPAQFDASTSCGSTNALGVCPVPSLANTIVSYAWNFGDGSPIVTTFWPVATRTWSRWDCRRQSSTH